MSKRVLAAAAAVAIGLVSSVAAAASNTYVVYPDNSSPTGYSSNGPAGAFQYDPDTARPGMTNSAPVGFGTSSANASVSSSGANPSDRYTTFRIDTTALFGHAVSLQDLTAFSYQTNSTGSLDWRPTIYTAKTGTNDYGSFYHSRLQALPTPAGDGNWHNVDTESLLWFDSHQENGNQTPFATFSSLQAGSVTYLPTGTSRDYSSDIISFIDITLGANSGGGTEAGSLDDIVLTAGRDTVTLNLEATAPAPLPNASYAALPLLALLAAPKLLKRTKTA